jgi:hypothetical protein
MEGRGKDGTEWKRIERNRKDKWAGQGRAGRKIL